MRKWQLPLTIAGLLAVLLGMNYVVDYQNQKAADEAKAIEKQRQEAENKAMAAKTPPEDGMKHGPGPELPGGGGEVFALPGNSGPAQAPVKVEIFVNNSKSCQSINPDLEAMQTAYGKLLRVEWYSMADPKVAERSDKMKIGCEAGLAVNGKIDVEITKDGGKQVVGFRGPAGEKFKLDDVYAAVNAELQRKGKQPPAAALAKMGQLQAAPSSPHAH